MGAMKRERLRELIRAEFQRWGRIGGKTRAKKLTKEQRQESARKAARARWGGGS